ncbi:MAG: cell division protein FtsA [Bacteroidetes bacterium]|nr:MAG: cell division protein FtsA [Bacteroidota bacterium]TAF93793.1 MAG: cell division protein FtsA [Bacteroidota bacterium]
MTQHHFSTHPITRPDAESPIIVGLDIGTTKIACIAGRKNEQGKIDILGFGKANSSGVQHGQVLNIDQTIRAIGAALKACYDNFPELETQNVYVGIAGHHIKSLQTRGDIVRQNADVEIAKEEIDLLIKNQYKTFIPAGDEIIDVIPQDYSVDNHANITDPVGRTGVKVGANFHIITGDKIAIKNINRAVERSGLKAKDLVLQPLASSAAVLNEVDLEAGVAILDIGGGTSDLAVFYDGILQHTAVIPFGGENITNDIKNGLGVLKGQAEAMKTQFGSAVAAKAAKNAYISIPGIGGMANKEISTEMLSQIIEARMTEILEFVEFHFKHGGIDKRKINGGIILTGGGSQLQNIVQLTEYILALPARRGVPTEYLASDHIDEVKKPMYATCIGLILKGVNDFENNNSFIAAKQQVQGSTVLQTTPVVTVAAPAGANANAEPAAATEPGVKPAVVSTRNKVFWSKFKNTILELFDGAEDTKL